MYIKTNPQHKVNWGLLEISERGNNMIGLEWDPENHLSMLDFDGIHFFDLTMNLEERISTKHFNCKQMKDSNPHQCLTNYQMEKLNCSFPWDKNSNKKLNPCTTKEDAANYLQLSNQLRDYTSIERQELSNLDCWTPKCNKTSWKRMVEEKHRKSDDYHKNDGFIFYIYSSPGVCDLLMRETSQIVVI